MILDSTLQFSNAQSLITTTSTGSTFIIDLAAGGATSASTYPTGSALNLTYGNATSFGEDLGIGSGMNNLFVGIYISTAFLTANSATLNVQFQGAADSGATGTVSALTWTTYAETGPIAAASLTTASGTPDGSGVIKMWWPHRAIAAALPRFVRLNYALPGSTAFTAGVLSAYVMLSRDDWSAGQYPSNFVVGA